MAKTTYKKPAKSNLENADYAAYVTGQKGNDSAQPTITVYYKAEANSGYHFVGWFAAAEGGSALSENLEYTCSFTASSTSSGSPTVKNLYARFEQDAAAAAVYTGGTGEPTNYATLGAALTAAANGDLIVLQGNIGEAQTISKNITLDFNGYKIQGSANNLVTVTGTVTFVDNSLGTPGGVTTTGATAVLVSGGSLTINDGKYAGATYAVERTGGSVTIKNGGFTGNTQDINGTITLNGGFFINNGGLSVGETYAVTPHIPSGMKYSTGYEYMVVSKTSANYPVCTVISKKTGVDTIRINFSTLEAAIAYANNNADDSREKTILLHENYTLPAGNYTIPHHTILSVPYGADQTDANTVIQRVMEAAEPTSAYCTLTLVNGVHIDVRGAIEVGGTQMTGGQFETAISRPGGPTYGLMIMNSGSSITLYDESNFYAWGFVQGEGTIDVRRGAVVKEQFQINDWKTLSPTCAMAIGTSVDYQLHVLPVNQYFIQNVEVKATYRPGSRLLAQVAATVPQLVNNSTVMVALAFNDVGIIGVRYSATEKAADPDLDDDVAIFLMNNNDDSEDTWVRKSYDVAHDVQLYEANNSAYLGSLAMKVKFKEPISAMGMSVSSLDVDSRDFVLPIANNFKIHLKDGNLYVTQDTELLPGSEIEIDKKATMTIMDSVWNAKTRVMDGNKPQTLYLYDKDQWEKYVSGVVSGDNLVMGYGSRIKYRHGGVPTVRPITLEGGLDDAKLTVHGTVDVRGYLKSTTGDKTCTPVLPYTELSGGFKRVDESTKSVVDCDPQTDGGASITSTIEDAGTIIFSRTAQSESSSYVANYLWQVDEVTKGGDVHYIGNHAIPALLTNGDGSFVRTKNAPAGRSYCFIDFNSVGTWKALVTDGCFVYEIVENETIYYAKPQDYVQLLHGKTAEEDHTYKSADGTRTLILVDDCQWWEVKPVAGHPDLFECKHKDNHVFYYYDYEKSKWKEKRYTITWNTWNGEPWDTYNVKYGVKPQYLGTIPERESDAYYTYDFIGWAPEITDQTIVTADVTYTAQYKRKDVMYTVTWKDLSGNTIETGYYKIGDVPTCTSEIDMTGKEWTPAVSAVTGNTIYQLTAKNTDGPFDIKFMNWNGSQIGATQSVAKNDLPVAPANPTKAALADVEFVFAGWRAADNTVYASNAIPAATANATYTATFTEQPITYAITWKNYDGTPLLVQDVTPNTVPQYTGATPSNGEEYAFIGWTPTVVAATTDAEYTAVFELRERTVDGETYTIPASTQQSLTTITIKDDGKLVIPVSSSLTVDNLILEANSSASGQLDVPSNSNIITVNAYFDLKLNTEARHWHAFGVPWVVNLDATPLTEVESGRTLVLGRDYDIIWYDGAERAANGPGAHCWKYVEHGTHILQPGQGYMIAFPMAVQTVRFAKATGTPVLYTGSVTVTADQIGAISNPMAYHATLGNVGTGVGYAHDGGEIGHDDYEEVTIENRRFVVGKTVYISPTSGGSVVINKADGGVSPVAVPARRGAAADRPYLILEDYYTVALTPDNGSRAAKVYVLPEEDKVDEYINGRDLVKFGMSDRKAQIWVNRYGTKLGLNTTAPVNEVAEFPISVYAPAAGEYTIDLQAQPDEDYTVYLTQNGEAIWNLSDAPYVVNLNAGVNKTYALRLSARKAPQTATGIDEAIIDAQGDTRKVLIDNKVYIIRGNNIYTVDGQLVK